MPKAQSPRTVFAALVLIGAVIGLSVLSRVGVDAQPSGTPTQFDDIVASDPADYDVYQIKLTYTGSQSKATPTLLLYGAGRAPNVDEFESYRTPGIHYGNDAIKVIELSVMGSTIERLIQGLIDRPPLQVAGGPPDSLISLMIERDTATVFEHLTDDIEADQLLNVLQGAIRPESASHRETARRFRNFTVGPN